MKIEVSLGELVDRVTILSIKATKVKDEKKLSNIRKEQQYCNALLREVGVTRDSEEFKRLVSVNLAIWEAEDAIRLKEKQQEFDSRFIHLARTIYLLNDVRAAIKTEMNLKWNSSLSEEKEYEGY